MAWASGSVIAVAGMVTPPIAAADGNVWMSSAGTATITGPQFWFYYVNPGTSSVTVIAGSATGNESRLPSQLISDANFVYGVYSTNYPRVYIASCALAGNAYSDVLGISSNDNYPGLVKVGATAVSTGSVSSGGRAIKWTLSPKAFTTSNNFGAILGMAIYDGTNVWAAENSSSTIWKINPSTLAATSYTLPAATGLPSPNPYGNQIGFDGRHIYLSAGAGGIIIWDTIGLTGTVIGATVTNNCYYSTNANLVYVSDASGNIYTMPVGGGSLTLSQNIVGITGTGVNIAGFGDGPSNTIWATAISSGPFGNLAWFLSAPASGLQIVMII